MPTDPYLSGAYVKAKADATDAFNAAQANITARQQKTLQQYGFDPQGNVDSTNKYGRYQQIENNFTTGTKDVTDARGLAQKQAGLQSQFDSQYNPLGELTMDASTPHGGFQNLLGSESNDLDTLEQDSESRGLGHTGLGAQASKSLGFQHEGERGNFKDQLLQQLIGQGKQQRGLDFQHGVDQQSMMTDLFNANSGFDAERNQAQYARNNSDMEALIRSIMDAQAADDGAAKATADKAAADKAAADKAAADAAAAKTKTMAPDESDSLSRYLANHPASKAQTAPGALKLKYLG